MLHFGLNMPLFLMVLHGSIMILTVFLLRTLFKNHLPKFVFPVLWSLVLFRLLVPFSLSSPISTPVPDWHLNLLEAPTVYLVESTTTDTTDTTTEESVTYSFAESHDMVPSNWRLILLLVNGLGTVATAGILLCQKQRYTKKLNNSLLIEHNRSIQTILSEMNMEHILVFSNDEISSPLVCGLFNPRIYLPTGMDFQQIQLLHHILYHEIMHIKRKDNWLKTVMLIAVCLHWYNPLVWLMSKYLSSDLEAACDAAVLRQMDSTQRQSYAGSLLTMAIMGNRSSLLYSSFSKTEVERRIKNILTYKKLTTFTLLCSILFLLSSTIAFATGGQAPFSAYLSSFCGSTSSRWGVKAGLARDIALGEKAGNRADDVIFNVLDADATNDPEIIRTQVLTDLAKEFGVEKGAFKVVVTLCLSDEEVEREYVTQGITKGPDGFYVYQGETIRTYKDGMLGSVQTKEEGEVDVYVNRNRLGQISSVTVLRKGDSEFDQRSKEIERNHYQYKINTYETTSTAYENTAVEQYSVLETNQTGDLSYGQ
ncbi:hypothetical protein acsn021_20580 [Anaerocolumna cellulosilytica]|uniref:Uncharacterized protein n=1 Tax=Anaerocolumna cellulosilytica TaxID=433286 RepID=A0A6S6QZL0_9FIRM|nr:M56 family metallopeptidase [Anaerocolumna cellulosilytica]MBB5194299.1 beta-lactamase regulating signal transducer with metallopeptidase domain [Anaerocolumna cellulosilytica]BCJ94489.1 hypothetical protein acsn021_20580 [Anaerocolumna cellulosilytica]